MNTLGTAATSPPEICQHAVKHLAGLQAAVGTLAEDWRHSARSVTQQTAGAARPVPGT